MVVKKCHQEWFKTTLVDIDLSDIETIQRKAEQGRSNAEETVTRKKEGRLLEKSELVDSQSCCATTIEVNKLACLALTNREANKNAGVLHVSLLKLAELVSKSGRVKAAAATTTGSLYRLERSV